MAWGDKLVAGGTSFGLRALRGKQVPEAGRAANQFSGSGNFEALGDGLFGLLHGGSARKQSARVVMARGNLELCEFASTFSRWESARDEGGDRAAITVFRHVRSAVGRRLPGFARAPMDAQEVASAIEHAVGEAGLKPAQAAGIVLRNASRRACRPLSITQWFMLVANHCRRGEIIRRDDPISFENHRLH